MKIGFIGCGNMAGAMVGGMIGSGKVDKTDIIVSARSQETLQKRSKALGVATHLRPPPDRHHRLPYLV